MTEHGACAQARLPPFLMAGIADRDVFSRPTIDYEEIQFNRMDSTLTSLSAYLTAQNFTTALVSFGWKLLSAVVVLLMGLVLIKMVTSLLRSALRRTVHDTTIRYYTLSATKILLWVVLILILLGIFGIQTTSLVAILGAAGLAVGLALQGSLSNFAAGFMLMIFRPFKAGDEIEVAGVSGTVIEIGIFSTIVDTPEHVRAFIPNGTIFSGVIRNKSLNEYLRLEIKISVDKDTDITRTQQIIQRLLAGNDMILEVPRPEVQVVENPAEGIMIAVRPYVKLRYADSVLTVVSKEVREELRAAGIMVLR